MSDRVTVLRKGQMAATVDTAAVTKAEPRQLVLCSLCDATAREFAPPAVERSIALPLNKGDVVNALHMDRDRIVVRYTDADGFLCLLLVTFGEADL